MRKILKNCFGEGSRFQRLALRAGIALVVLLSCLSARADYPIMPQHYAADPTAVEHDGRLYVYCSNDEENGDGTGYIMDSIVCFSTDDLKNWTDHGVVFDADDLSSWYSGTAWAPCIATNNNKFYLYFGDAYWGVGVVSSDSPTGPFTAPKNDLVVQRGVTPGADSTWLFDPCAFVDDDGQPYLYFGGEGSNQARVVMLDTNMYDTIGSAMPIDFPDFFEASLMHKRDGIYYLSYADNYNSDYTDPPPTPGSQIAYMTSSSPTNGFVYQGVALGPPPVNFGNNNHHTFFTYQGQWYAVYHNRYQADQDGVSTTEHRNICLDELNYNPDGTIQPVVCTQDGLPQLKNLDPYVRVEGETLAQESGIETEVCSEGGMDVTAISDGDWIRIRGVDFGSGATNFVARVASVYSGGSIELRLDSLGGTLAGTCLVPNTGGSQNWSSGVCSVTGASGVHDLYLKFNGGTATNLFKLDWWQFNLNEIPGSTTNNLPAPAHLYSFNESGGSTVIDEIGGANGTLPAGGTLTGATLSLSGAGQYADLPDGIMSAMTECTIATWVKLDTVADWVRVFDFGSGTGTYMFLTPDYWGNTVRFAITTGGGEQVITGTEILPAGTWTHVAVTLDGTNGTLYVNGSAVGSQAVSLTPADLGNTTQNWIGRSQYSNDGFLDGQFNEFRIYDVALSSTEMTQLYESSIANGLPPETATIDVSTTYQQIEGIGGAVCFYNGWFPAHPNWEEIADEAFSGLNISMLRLGNWWRGTGGQDTASYEIVDAAKQRLGDDLPLLMSSWSPPAYLKSNGEVANGGTLIKVGGQYDYAGFADYWYQSLQDYAAHGIVPTWVSIQNEPDWTADYDSCRFNPTEASWGGTNYASYALALSAVYQNLQSNMASPPKLLGPGCIGLYGNAGAYQDYVAAMNPDHYYGTAHHLYGGSTDGTPDGYNTAFSTLSTIHPEKPRFMTEFGDINGMIECANLIHNLMVVEQVSGYNHWTLMWPGENGLVEIENPWDQVNWTNPKGYWLNPAYWSVKHFSYYIRPGYTRVAASSSDSSVLTSAYLSPDGGRLVTVFINRDTNTPVTVNLDTGSFSYGQSSVYQSTETTHFVSMGSVTGSELTLPAGSLTTVVMDEVVAVGAASNPSPADGAIEVAPNTTLGWTPGSNATSFAVYVGTDSNAVATATTGSPEYQGTVSSNAFTSVALNFDTDYYWRVDGLTYSSSSTGSVWSFSTAAPSIVPGVPSPLASELYNVNFAGTSNDGTYPVANGLMMAAPTTGGSNLWNNIVSPGAPWDNPGTVTLADANEANTATVSLNIGGGSIWQGNPVDWASYFAEFTAMSNSAPWPSYMGDSGTAWVRFGGLDTSASYDVYVYFTWNRGDDSYTYTLTEGSANVSSNTLASDRAMIVANPASYVEGTSYVVFADVTPSGSGTIQISTGNYSALQLVKRPAVVVAPDAPTGLDAVAVSASQIDLSWNVVVDADSYNVKRSTTSGAPYETVVSNVVSTSYSDASGLSAGTRYYYVVSAVNLGGESASSNETNAVPSAIIVPGEYLIAEHAIVGGTNMSLTVSNSILGHDYWMLATDSLLAPDWQLVGAGQAGTGTNLEFSIPIDGALTNRYFKLDVQRQ